MTRTLKVSALVALIFSMSSLVWAQAKPDFAGKWTLDEAKSDPAPQRGGGGGGGGGGGRGMGRGGGAAATALNITQTPAQLTIDRTMGQGNQTAVYKLDGSESTNEMGMGKATSKASWEGASLVITTSQTMQGRGGEPMTIQLKEVYSLEGGALQVIRSTETPNGTQSRKLI